MWQKNIKVIPYCSFGRLLLDVYIGNPRTATVSVILFNFFLIRLPQCAYSIWSYYTRSMTVYVLALISNNCTMVRLYEVRTIIAEISSMMIRVTKLLHFHISGAGL